MMTFEVKNPNFEQVVRNSFAKQGLMSHLGAKLLRVEAGLVVIELPYVDELTQQHGFFHAGATTSVVDSACGYAALTLMPPQTEVLSVEYKVNFVAPALGDSLIAEGRVLKAGRTITVCQGDVFVLVHQQKSLCATMLATMIKRPFVISS